MAPFQKVPLLEDKSTSTSNSFLKLPEWPHNERLAAEKELLGFYVSGHPIMPYLSVLNRYALARIRDLSEQPNRALIRMGGLVTALQQGVSKKTNKPYLMATLEDQDGSVQVLCMNENYEQHKEALAIGALVFVTGELNKGEDKPKIFPIDIYSVDEAIKKYTTLVHIRLKAGASNTQTFEKIRELTQAFPGKCPLFLCLIRPTGEYVFIETNDRFWITPCQQFQTAVESQLGKEAYYAKVDVTPPERPARRWERKTEESQNGRPAAKQRAQNGKG